MQFLDNKVRPAGFTEFFLVNRDLASILAEEGINPPTNQGIQTIRNTGQDRFNVVINFPELPPKSGMPWPVQA